MRVALTSGAYQARSLIAGAQRCVNLYPESNPQDAQMPVPITHYLTPGLTLKLSLPNVSVIRALYCASNGDLYAVCGPTVYYIDNSFTPTALGTIADLTTPVSMCDNGLSIVIVDGTSSGYAIDMIARTFGAISSPDFYGANRVFYMDTYFIFNRPSTSQFYISLSLPSYSMLTGGTAFDALDIAAKAGSPDPLVSVMVSQDTLYLIGELTSEVWINSGAADFTFQKLPGTFWEHGCAAAFSVAQEGMSVFWLSRDRQGNAIVVKTEYYQTLQISTHAIEAEFQTYSRIDDAIGFCYQQQGHNFYVLTFPSADKTWAFEIATSQWHELAWSDLNGGVHRHRGNVCCFAYGMNLVGDWQNGAIYQLDPASLTDNGNPIVRIRTFPHLIQDNKRVTYNEFVADMQVGTATGSTTDSPPVVSLRWSDTRGASFGNPVKQSVGSGGQYLTNVKWSRLGMARDRIFELSWSGAFSTALNGAFIETEAHES